MPAAAQPGATMPPAGDLRFHVVRNGSRIGQHHVGLRQDGAVWTAEIRVEIAVGLGPVVLYRYALTAREVWRDGRFATFGSETNDDGKRLTVRAERRAEGVVVDATDLPRQVLAEDTIPLTHWNRQCMTAPLFAARDGVAARPRVQPRGEESITLADGRSIRAERYALSGDVDLDDWYAADGSWAALRTTGRDGSTIDYRRLA